MIDSLHQVENGESDPTSVLSAVSAITTDPDLISLESSKKVLDIIQESVKFEEELTHENALAGITTVSNLACTLKLIENELGEYSLKENWLRTMDVVNIVLSAVQSCDQPFAANSDIIKASKNKFGEQGS